MTVAELRAALAALPAGADGWTVVLSRDSEGNRFSPLRDVARGNYEHETRWTDEGGFIDEHELEHPDLAALPLNAVCLWPVR